MKNWFTANFAALFVGAFLFTACDEGSAPAPQPQPNPDETTVPPGMVVPGADGSCPEGMELVERVAQTLCQRVEENESEPPQCGDEEVFDEEMQMCVSSQDPCTSCDENQVCSDGACTCAPPPEEWIREGNKVYCFGRNDCILGFDEVTCTWSCGDSSDDPSPMFWGSPHDSILRDCEAAE